MKRATLAALLVFVCSCSSVQAEVKRNGVFAPVRYLCPAENGGVFEMDSEMRGGPQTQKLLVTLRDEEPETIRVLKRDTKQADWREEAFLDLRKPLTGDAKYAADSVLKVFNAINDRVCKTGQRDFHRFVAENREREAAESN